MPKKNLKGRKGGKTLKIVNKKVSVTKRVKKQKLKGKTLRLNKKSKGIKKNKSDEKGKKRFNNQKGGKKGQPKKKNEEQLDKELAQYFIRSGDTETAKAHLDCELDDYWKKEDAVPTKKVDSKLHTFNDQALITEDTAVNSGVHS